MVRAIVYSYYRVLYIFMECVNAGCKNNLETLENDTCIIHTHLVEVPQVFSIRGLFGVHILLHCTYMTNRNCAMMQILFGSMAWKTGIHDTRDCNFK